jgi:hypothetical protein
MHFFKHKRLIGTLIQFGVTGLIARISGSIKSGADYFLIKLKILKKFPKWSPE